MIKRAFQAGEVHSVFDLLLQEVYRVDTDQSATVIRFGIIPDRTAIFLTFRAGLEEDIPSDNLDRARQGQAFVLEAQRIRPEQNIRRYFGNFPAPGTRRKRLTLYAPRHTLTAQLDTDFKL